MLHRPHARSASLAPTHGTEAAFLLSPTGMCGTAGGGRAWSWSKAATVWCELTLRLPFADRRGHEALPACDARLPARGRGFRPRRSRRTCSSPTESAPSRGRLSNREPRRGVTFVAEKRLERRGTGTFARTPLRPIRLTGCHSDRTHREGGWQNWTGGRVRGAVQNDGVHIEPDPKRPHRPDEGSAPAESSHLATPVASAPRHGRKIQIRSPSRADAIGLTN